ncbi:hypothetical protein Salat_1896000 [Sesamum alatum]|uniref:Secreted protein n=1 Tax=Sesamum alatum TaxID=300844 RepID=A0AAE1Y4I0_9LAMI|nr:hypothetical protein Salat_1896000 [Sesamum alatum]
MGAVLITRHRVWLLLRLLNLRPSMSLCHSPPTELIKLAALSSPCTLSSRRLISRRHLLGIRLALTTFQLPRAAAIARVSSDSRFPTPAARVSPCNISSSTTAATSRDLSYSRVSTLPTTAFSPSTLASRVPHLFSRFSWTVTGDLFDV